MARPHALSKPTTTGVVILPPEVVDPNAPYPWTMPSKATLDASTKRVFTHYFTQFPPSVDNVADPNDYYTTQWNAQNGEGGKWSQYGGWFRDKPKVITRPVAGDYMLADFQREVRQASAAGIDGWAMDMLALTGYHWTRVNLMLQAMAVVPSFRMMLMPDSTTLKDQTALASAVNSIYDHPQLERYNGKVVICPFGAELQSGGASWWTSWIDLLRTNHNREVSFMPCGLNPSIDAFKSFSFGISYWGGRSPASIDSSVAQQVQAAGKLFMMPVAPQDYRAHQVIYDEACNTETLRECWDIANTYAQWAQIVTWNDYAENAHIAPSYRKGTALLDLNAYYIAWFKTGVAPTITRNALFLSHRIHTYAVATPSQPSRANLRTGSTAARDTVEVVSFLTGTQTVNVVINGVTTSYSANAGVTAHTVALPAGVSGTISANIASGPTVTSAFPLVAAPSLQNLQYHFASSEPATS